MARTTVLTEIPDDLFDELKISADAMDISVETYVAVRLEQQARQARRDRNGDTGAPRTPGPPQALVLLTGPAAEVALQSGGYRHRDVARWVSHAVIEQAQREMQPKPKTADGNSDGDDSEQSE